MPGLPKLSEIVKRLSAPEDQIESMLSATGISIPPGPTKMLANIMEQVEETAPFGTLGENKLSLPELPTFPELALPSFPFAPAETKMPTTKGGVGVEETGETPVEETPTETIGANGEIDV